MTPIQAAEKLEKLATFFTPEVSRALRLGAAALRDSEWLPIEGAPKDGTKVDLWLSSKDCVEQWRECDCWWVPQRKLWCNLRGWWDCASHYRPLPSPPKEQK